MLTSGHGCGQPVVGVAACIGQLDCNHSFCDYWVLVNEECWHFSPKKLNYYCSYNTYIYIYTDLASPTPHPSLLLYAQLLSWWIFLPKTRFEQSDHSSQLVSCKTKNLTLLSLKPTMFPRTQKLGRIWRLYLVTWNSFVKAYRCKAMSTGQRIAMVVLHILVGET